MNKFVFPTTGHFLTLDQHPSGHSAVDSLLLGHHPLGHKVQLKHLLIQVAFTGPGSR